MPVPSRPAASWIGLGAAAVLVAGVLATRRGGLPGPGLPAILAVTHAAALAFFWLAGGWGYGLALERLLAPARRDPLIAAGIGVAAMLTAGKCLSLVPGFGLASWGLPAAGVTLAILLGPWRRAVPSASACLFLLSVPAGTLLVAAASAPGWLWSTEYGGYDALSYHLQLPAEWIQLGRSQGLEHCAYSYLPGYVEATYAHLMEMAGHRSTGALAAQIYHAGLVLLSAMLVGRLLPVGQRFVAAAIVLGTPWVIVTGSLAYNEAALLTGLATGWLVARRLVDGGSWRDGLLLGLVLGAAVGAKATAIGFVALPVGLLAILTGPDRLGARIGRLLLGAGVAAVVLIPWLGPNAAVVGNPVFPLMSGSMPGHWTDAQAARWASGHHAVPSLSALWNEFVRFGIGAAPTPDTRWYAQWSILPLLLLAVAAGSIFRRSTRAATIGPLVMIVVQIVFWMVLTHQKSRFLIPIVVPAAVMLARCAAWLPGQVRCGAAALYILLPTILYLRETNNAPAAAIGGGPDLSGAFAAPEAPPSLARWMNHDLPADARVLLIGDAAPFYYERQNFTWSTVWDSTICAALEALESETNPYTHVVLDPVMLQIWTASGWSDPRLDLERVTPLLQRTTRELARFGDGKILYEVR